MRADVLILGQGLAGTLLAWELERAGISFAIADPYPPTASATWAAAGIINPITGRRLVKSWRIETLLPATRETYCGIETALGIPLWRAMRVRRLFADERERAVFAARRASEELAAFVEDADETGFWVRDAAQVDLRALIDASRARWRARGYFVDTNAGTGGAGWTADNLAGRYELVVHCTGAAVLRSDEFGFVPWETSKGDILEIAVDGLARDVVLNRRQWIVPVGERNAWVGATHEPAITDPRPSPAARAALEASARALLGGRAFAVVGHRAGIRVNLPDKRPAAGRNPEFARRGVINGLGAKGALWAPWLARQWVEHLETGRRFDPEIDVARFARRSH